MLTLFCLTFVFLCSLLFLYIFLTKRTLEALKTKLNLLEEKHKEFFPKAELKRLLAEQVKNFYAKQRQEPRKCSK